MLLLITGSGDGTSDMLCSRLGIDVFRFNYDLFSDYKIIFKIDYWEIENPSGHKITSETVTNAFWWKAFNFFIIDKDSFVIEEIKYVTREIYNWCRINLITKGNSPDFHNSIGKLNILNFAKKYFQIPDTYVISSYFDNNINFRSDPVAKSLTSGATDSKRFLFTTKIDIVNIDYSHLWYLQETIYSLYDITVLVCGSDLFAFSRSRKNLKGLDWRSEQDFNIYSEEWIPYTLNNDDIVKFNKLNQKLKINWGRYDLLLKEKDLIFLEFNANGQFLFLDYFNNYGIHDSFISYLKK